MRILSAKDVFNLISQIEAINVIEATMMSVSKGECLLPLRNVIDLGESKKLGIMPGSLGYGNTYGAKILSLFPENPKKGLSSHIGLILLFDPETGVPKAAINADALTAVRTSAATAVATKCLSNKDASTMTIIGSGEQAEFHIRSIPLVRNIKDINVVATSIEKAQDLIKKMTTKFPKITFNGFDCAEEVTKKSDIICTVTSSKIPVVFGDWVQNGCHINAVGASIPIFQEIDEAVILKAKIFTDYKPSLLAQAKEIIEALKNDLISETQILAEIGEVLNFTKPGRKHQKDITLYRSMGIAAQDISCAEFVLEKAIQKDAGAEVSIL